MSPVSTGASVLDSALDGGFPRGRTTLLAGTPGTGKTTLGMQFLQAGFDEGESGLFVTTEQTLGELADSFADFEFDLDHDELIVTSLNPMPGRSVESENPVVTLQGFRGQEIPGEEFGVPFEPQNLRRALERFDGADRVVLDSVSGLRAVTPNEDVYRRVILDLVRLFSDDFEATSIFTAEDRERVSTPALAYNTHGVIRLWREERGGEDHHLVKVEKMRGVDHDRRTYELEFSSRGVRIIPRLRTKPDRLADSEMMSTGVDGLDALTGGGFVFGGLNVIRTDGHATTASLLTSIQSEAIEAGATLAIVPPARLGVEGLLEAVDRHVGPHEELLEDDRLVVLDMVSDREPIHHNHLAFQRFDGDLVDAFRRIYDVAEGTSLVTTLHLLPVVQGSSPEMARRARYWAQANRTTSRDLIIYQVNPGVVDDHLAAFYVDTAQTVVDTYVDDVGIQYVKLSKSPRGYLGSERVVEYVDEPPYVRVQTGPQAERE